MRKVKQGKRGWGERRWKPTSHVIRHCWAQCSAGHFLLCDLEHAQVLEPPPPLTSHHLPQMAVRNGSITHEVAHQSRVPLHWAFRSQSHPVRSKQVTLQSLGPESLTSKAIKQHLFFFSLLLSWGLLFSETREVKGKFEGKVGRSHNVKEAGFCFYFPLQVYRVERVKINTHVLWYHRNK